MCGMADFQVSQLIEYMLDKLPVSEDQVIRKYLGCSYELHGRTPKGMDCYGLIILIYADLGHQLWDINEEYSEGWAWKGKDYFYENYYRQWTKHSVPQKFDVVLFKNKQGNAIHGGVVLSGGRFIHCSKNAGVVTTRLTEWQHKVEGFYRLK